MTLKREEHDERHWHIDNLLTHMTGVFEHDVNGIISTGMHKKGRKRQTLSSWNALLENVYKLQIDLRTQGSCIKKMKTRNRKTLPIHV